MTDKRARKISANIFQTFSKFWQIFHKISMILYENCGVFFLQFLKSEKKVINKFRSILFHILLNNCVLYSRIMVAIFYSNWKERIEGSATHFPKTSCNKLIFVSFLTNAVFQPLECLLWSKCTSLWAIKALKIMILQKNMVLQNS